MNENDFLRRLVEKTKESEIYKRREDLINRYKDYPYSVFMENLTIDYQTGVITEKEAKSLIFGKLIQECKPILLGIRHITLPIAPLLISMIVKCLDYKYINRTDEYKEHFTKILQIITKLDYIDREQPDEQQLKEVLSNCYRYYTFFEENNIEHNFWHLELTPIF